MIMHGTNKRKNHSISHVSKEYANWIRANTNMTINEIKKEVESEFMIQNISKWKVGGKQKQYCNTYAFNALSLGVVISNAIFLKHVQEKINSNKLTVFRNPVEQICAGLKIKYKYRLIKTDGDIGDIEDGYFSYEPTFFVTSKMMIDKRLLEPVGLKQKIEQYEYNKKLLNKRLTKQYEYAKKQYEYAKKQYEYANELAKKRMGIDVDFDGDDDVDFFDVMLSIDAKLTELLKNAD